MIDPSTEFGARVERRLREDTLIWLTTVRADGTPQPSPVWFLWDGTSMLIYSQPNKQKLRNIATQPKVALNFNGDEQGGDIIVLTGTAELVEDAPSVAESAEYLAKYREEIAGIGMTLDRFSATYSVALRVTPIAVRGH